MIRMLILAALLGFIAQQPPDSPYDADGHLKAEHQIPAGDYCQNARVYEENQQRLARRGKAGPSAAHPCDCTFSCHVDENGNVYEYGGEKEPACKAYCSKDQRRCTCHPEPVCDSHASARVDMHGAVVAVARK